MYILSAEFKAIPTSLNMKQATKYMTFSRMYAFLFIYQIQEYPVVTRYFCTYSTVVRGSHDPL